MLQALFFIGSEDMVVLEPEFPLGTFAISLCFVVAASIGLYALFVKGGYRVRTKGDRLFVLFLSFLMTGILYQALDPIIRHLSSYSDLRNGRYLQVNGILEKFYSPSEIHSGNLYLIDSEVKKNILRLLKIDRSPKGGCINRGIKNVAGLVGKKLEVKYKIINHEACVLLVEISK